MRGSEWTIKATTAYRTVPDLPVNPPESEPRVCGTCYWFEPCPCGRCLWGVCRRMGGYHPHEYMDEDSSCDDWKEA